RQPLLAELRRTAHIDEHADHVTLLADIDAAAITHEVRADMGRQDRYDGNVGLWPQLTSEPNRGIAGADAVQHESFPARRPRQCSGIADDADAACGAAC